MFMNNVVNSDKTKAIMPILKGYIISIIISCVLLLIYAIILVKTNINENTINTVVITITAVSILIGSSISCLRVKKNGILNGLCIGAIYFITLYLISSIFWVGFSLNLKAILMVSLGTVIGGIGGIIGINFKK